MHGPFAVDWLSKVVAWAMVAIANPVVEGLLLGRIGQPAKLEGQGWNPKLHKACLVGADEAVLIRLLVELHLNVIPLGRGARIVP